jgi:hypothetical protein
MTISVNAPGSVERMPTAITAAALGSLALAVGFSAARGDRRIVAYVIVWAVLACIARAAHRRWPLPRATLWALTIAAAVHLAGGLLPSPDPSAPILYETWLVDGVVKFDQIAHAGISAVVTIALFQALAHVVDQGRAGPAARAVLAMLVCWGFGAANELFEFLSGLRFHDSYAGGLDNAGWDMAYNTAGSLAAALCCAIAARSVVAVRR